MDRRNFLKGFITATTVAALAPVSLIEVPLTESTKFVDFDSICTIVLKQYRPIFADAFFSSPVFYFGKPIVQESIPIIEPIIRR
jgi:hypothetical protein